MFIVDDIKNYDPSFKPIFLASWSEWEEAGWIVICEKDGNYYVHEGGDNPFGRSWGEEWNPELVSQDDALNIMLEWADNEDEL